MEERGISLKVVYLKNFCIKKNLEDHFLRWTNAWLTQTRDHSLPRSNKRSHLITTNLEVTNIINLT